jgi:hypothetical protein
LKEREESRRKERGGRRRRRRRSRRRRRGRRRRRRKKKREECKTEYVDNNEKNMYIYKPAVHCLLISSVSNLAYPSQTNVDDISPE